MTKLFALTRPGHVPAANVLVIALDATGPLDLTGRHVLVVAPALNSRLRHWMSDDREARRAAEERLDATVDGLERAGVHASGHVGDADPLQAIADALPTFAADEVVIAAHGEHSRRLAYEIATRARERFGLPIVNTEEQLHRAA
jgi:nucleotide-binding universal stress UspA family protein